ncbi:methyl-accepting chemotaxis protein [Coralloluteibacterium thermophilus]|uniref:Methyl-accepting chemotaxis protein n=1 Tax=Coralloluteibacterium thermophilum TaxID=2707049 RepID=A0ABV9NHM2_9GAMM
MTFLKKIQTAFGDLSIRRKFVVLNVLLAFGVVALAVTAARIQYVDLRDSREAVLRTEVEMALGAIAHYAARAEAGELSEEEAQAAALATLETMRANDDVDYFFVHDMRPTLLMHPFRKDLVGRDVGDVVSPDGVAVYREQVAVARAGGGHVDFAWEKPGHDAPVQKMSYAAAYAPWNWVVATGIYMDDVQAQALVFTAIMTAAGGFVVISVFVLCWIIGSAIVVPMRAATEAADAVAAGRLDQPIAAGARDEVGRLLGAMRRMQSTLQDYSRAQLEMGRRHEAGEIGHRIDAAAFRGAYGEMAANTNALVAAHISVMMQLVALIEQYGRGDLSQDMPQLPGEKARVTEAMQATKAALTGIQDEILMLSAAAARGDFSARGDEAKYQHAFREMVAALNRLMQEADAGLSDVGRIMGALAEGDLTQRVEREYQGAFGRLAADANRTVEQLTGIVRGIKDSVETINTASGEIASGNADLSSRTEQQAASLEETASSMEELTSTVRQNAENARQANQLAVGAGDVAEAGGRVVDEVVTTMGAISESSKRIADIIGVIDGIAFQTNILALNAAVEAARAGEQGRGFAVVASEVRALAQRSADAAKEIKTLIEDSAEKVELGSSLVHRAGTTMGEIVTSVKRVTDIMGEITAASAEQSSGIDQVNRTVMQLDETTQQNAALVEEASAAARSLEVQAGELAQAVAVFRLEQAAAKPAAKPAPAPGPKPVRKQAEALAGAAASAAPKPAGPKPKIAAASVATSDAKTDPKADPEPRSARAARPARRAARAAKAAAPQPVLSDIDGDWQEF